MKKTLQLLILLLIILIGYLFYNNYIKSNKQIEKSEIIKKENIEEDIQNNLIKNLKYDVRFEDNSRYSITSDLSEITYVEEVETVNMTGVVASIIDKNGLIYKITSDKAVFNNSTYNTIFKKNVKITYLENLISSENLELDFAENIVIITNNVVYDGIKGVIKSDNIKVNLITKNIEIFMDNKKQKVEITSKN